MTAILENIKEFVNALKIFSEQHSKNTIDKFLEENTDRCVIIAGADDPVQKRPCRPHKDKETSDLRKFVDPDLKKNCERWGILLGPEILVIEDK